MVNVSGEIRSAGLAGSVGCTAAGFCVAPVAARTGLAPEVGAFPEIFAAVGGGDISPGFGRP
jgi:hypothetical protein